MRLAHPKAIDIWYDLTSQFFDSLSQSMIRYAHSKSDSYEWQHLQCRCLIESSLSRFSWSTTSLTPWQVCNLLSPTNFDNTWLHIAVWLLAVCVKPRANGRNIVGQQLPTLPWMLHVASLCTPCCMLLDVLACCCAKFETGQTFQSTTPGPTLLAQQSWELLRGLHAAGSNTLNT